MSFLQSMMGLGLSVIILMMAISIYVVVMVGLVVPIWSIAHCIKSNLSSNRKIAWILVMVFIWGLGALCYAAFVPSQKALKYQARLIIFLLLAALFMKPILERAMPKIEAETTAAKSDIAVKLTASTMSSVSDALDRYAADFGDYPSTKEGLKALKKMDQESETLQRPYLTEDPIDHWGHPLNYRYPGKVNAGSYDLFSTGPDGMGDGKASDDISNFIGSETSKSYCESEVESDQRMAESAGSNEWMQEYEKTLLSDILEPNEKKGWAVGLGLYGKKALPIYDRVLPVLQNQGDTGELQRILKRGKSRIVNCG